MNISRGQATRPIYHHEEHKSCCCRIQRSHSSYPPPSFQTNMNSKYILCHRWVPIQNTHKPTTENLTPTTMYTWHEGNSVLFGNTSEMGILTNQAMQTRTTLQEGKLHWRTETCINCMQDWSNIKPEVSEALAWSCLRRTNLGLRFSWLALHYNGATSTTPYRVAFRIPHADS